MPQIWLNNAGSQIVTSIMASSTSITLSDASRFPDPSPNWYLATLTQANSAEVSWEIVKVTGKSGATLTVERGQEGTTAVPWPGGSRIEARLTAETLERLAGDMQSLIYDPEGRATNVFDLSNHAGVLDGGEFTGGI